MAQIPQMRYLYLTSAFLRKKEETPLLYSFVNKYFELLVLLTHAVLKNQSISFHYPVAENIYNKKYTDCN